MKITVMKRNGSEEIHKPGCRDLKSRRGYVGDGDPWTIEIKDLGDLYASYWDCIADESVEDGNYQTLEHAYWAWRGEFTVMPCAGNVPEMAEPTADDEDEAVKANTKATAERKATGNRAENQELARWLVDLVAANIGGKSPAEKQKVANWLKALPTGGAGPDRYWPANMTRPDTADWQR